jgi:hypothetical protein
MDATTVPPGGPWAVPGCTLPTVRRPLRVAKLDELFTIAVRSVERVDRCRVRLELAPQAELAARAADLLVRETECCSFFTFTLTATGGRVSLDITVPGGHVDVLDALADRAVAGAGS